MLKGFFNTLLGCIQAYIYYPVKTSDALDAMGISFKCGKCLDQAIFEGIQAVEDEVCEPLLTNLIP